jgi:hypothetical protein
MKLSRNAITKALQSILRRLTSAVTLLHPICKTLLNKPLTQAEQYYKSDYDRLTKQIEYDGEYYQLIVKNGIIINIVNMKQS